MKGAFAVGILCAFAIATPAHGKAVPLFTDYVNSAGACTEHEADLLGLQQYQGMDIMSQADATSCAEFVISQRYCGIAPGTLPTLSKSANELCIEVAGNAPELKSFIWFHCGKYCGICKEDNGYISDCDDDGICDAEDCYDQDGFWAQKLDGQRLIDLFGDENGDGIADCDADLDSDGIADRCERVVPITFNPTMLPSASPSSSPSSAPSPSPSTGTPSAAPTLQPTVCETWPDLLPLDVSDNKLDAPFQLINGVNEHADSQEFRMKNMIGILGQDCKFYVETDGQKLNKSCTGKECCNYANKRFTDAYCPNYCGICKNSPTPLPSLAPSTSPSAKPTVNPTLIPTSTPSKAPTCYTRDDSLIISAGQQQLGGNIPNCEFYTKTDALLNPNPNKEGKYGHQCSGRGCCEFADLAFTWFYCPKFCGYCEVDMPTQFKNDCDGDSVVDYLDCYDTDKNNWDYVPGRPCDADDNSDGTANACDPTKAPTISPTTSPSTKSPSSAPSNSPSQSPSTHPSSSPSTTPTKAPTTLAPTSSPTECAKKKNLLPVQPGAPDCAHYTLTDARLNPTKKMIDGKELSGLTCTGKECCHFSNKPFTWFHCADFCDICDKDNVFVTDCDGDGASDYFDCYDGDNSAYLPINNRPCDMDSDSDGVGDVCEITNAPTAEPQKEPTQPPTISPSASPSGSPSASPSTAYPTYLPTNLPSISNLYYCRPETSAPTEIPTADPSTSPSVSPSLSPTTSPSTSPTESPTTSVCDTGKDLLPITSGALGLMGQDCAYYTRTDAAYNTKIVVINGKSVTGSNCKDTECCQFSNEAFTYFHCPAYCGICEKDNKYIKDCDKDNVTDYFDCYDSDPNSWKEEPNRPCDVDTNGDGRGDVCDPTIAPSGNPSAAPTGSPSAAPTAKPSLNPTIAPSSNPTPDNYTPAPTQTSAPTPVPTSLPTCYTRPDLLGGIILGSPSMDCAYYTKTDALYNTEKTLNASDGTVVNGATCRGTECCHFSNTEFTWFHCATYCNICELPSASPTVSPTTKEPSAQPTTSPTSGPTSAPTPSPSVSPTTSPTCLTFQDLLPLKDTSNRGLILPGCVNYIEWDGQRVNPDCKGKDCCQYANKEFTSFYCASTCNICTCDNAYIRDCDDDGVSDFFDCYDSDKNVWKEGDNGPCDADEDSDGISDKCECGYTEKPTVSPTTSPTVRDPTKAPSNSPTTSAPTVSPTVSPTESPTCGSAPDILPFSELKPGMKATLGLMGFSSTVCEMDCSKWIDSQKKANSNSGCNAVDPCSTNFAKHYCPTTCGICQGKPTASPTSPPTASPSISPTASPSSSPSASPSQGPTASPTASPSGSPTFSPTTADPTVNPTLSPSVSPSLSPTTCVPVVTPTAAPTLCSTKPNLLPIMGGGDCEYYTHSEAELIGEGSCKGAECCQFSDKQFTTYHCATFCEICDADNGLISDCDNDGIMDYQDCYDHDASKSTKEDGIPCDPDADSDGIADSCDQSPLVIPLMGMTESPTVVDQGGRGSIPTDGIFTLPGQSTSAPTQTAQGSPTKAPVQEPAPGPSQGTAPAPAPLPEPAATTASPVASPAKIECNDLLSNFCQYATNDKCTKNAIYHKACAKTCAENFFVSCPSDRRRSATALNVALDAHSAECSTTTRAQCDEPLIALMCPSSCN